MSKKPSKMRKAQYEQEMHTAAKAVRSHLVEKLAKELNKRAISVRKGDTVKIMRGEFTGKEGKVTEVDRAKKKVLIEKIIKKKSNGQERQVPIDASKVLITDIDRTDRKRFEAKKEGK